MVCRRRRLMSLMAGEDGSALPLVALWLMVTVLVAMSIVAGVGAAVDRARAQAAADAAALAGAAETSGLVGDGRAAAGAIAEINGGELVKYLESPGRSAQSAVVVTVVVSVDQATATAAAERFLAQDEFP